MKNFKYILTHSSGNLTIEYNPINWDSFNIVFRRSERYHSVLRSQILDAEFPLDGKAYIDDIYENYGIDTDIGCEIQYLDKNAGTYSTLFDGIIDLTQWVCLRDTTSVAIIDSSNAALFATRDEIEIPLNRTDDLDGSAISSYTYLETINVEGVDIEMKALWSDASNSISITTARSVPFTLYYGITASAWDFNTVGTSAVLPAVSLGSASGVIYTNNTGAAQTVRFRIVTAVQGTIAVAASNAWSWQFDSWSGKNGATNSMTQSASGSAGDSRGISQTYDSGYVTVSLAALETIELYHTWQGVATGGDIITPNFTIEPTYIEIVTVTSGASTTQVDMSLTHELAAMLLEIMTGQSDPLNAPLLGRTDSNPRTYASDGDYSLIGSASGLMLRGFPHTDQPFKTSFYDFFKSIDAVGNLGLWYDASNSEFVISAKEDFYEVSKIITLDEVQDLEISIATDEYFNEVLTGYEKEVDYEDVNGQQSFNVPAQFANDGKKIQNVLDIRSKYRADDYGIELARQSDYASTAGEDTRYDNDNFFVYARRVSTAFWTYQGYDSFATITGVYAPSTRLNLDITPKRNMLRHADRLSIPLFITNGDTNFMRSQFDLNLSTTKSAASAVAEKDDLAYSDLEEPLYYPEIYNFTAELSFANILQLISDPHGYVEFDYLGTTYSGYIIEVSSEPFNRRGNWTLLKRNPNRT